MGGVARWTKRRRGSGESCRGGSEMHSAAGMGFPSSSRVGCWVGDREDSAVVKPERWSMGMGSIARFA